MSSNIRFFSAGPLTVIAIIALIILVIILIPLLLLGIIGAAFTRMGFSWVAALAVVFLMLAGSAVNIPLYRVKREVLRVVHDGTMEFGSDTAFSHGQPWVTNVSLNLGGAIIPIMVSAYLIHQAVLIPGTSLLLPVCTGIILVSGITYLSTRMDPRTGIHVPLIVPALTALLIAYVVSGGPGATASVSAFVSGVAGTLIGGNIARLPQVKDLETGDVSIGGAGTFGSVFICCLLPALIA